LGSAPALKALITSRVPLHLRAEREYLVPPLGLPPLRPLPPLEQLTQYTSVRLFLERAQAVKPGFIVDSGNASAVVEICHRLDGLPLAIELAAARIRMLAPHALLARLERSLPLLTGGARDLPARQQTLRETIAWSHDLLAANEQTLFRRLAVFAGGAPFDAIERVATSESDVDVFEGLEQLVEHSLVRQEDAPNGDPRFSMLETIREFASEQLVASGEEIAVRAEHMAWCLGLVEPVERSAHGAFGASDLVWLNQIDLEHHNIRAALTWARERSEPQVVVRFAAALARFWRVRGYLHEGRSWVAAALAHADVGDPTTRLRLLQGAGLIAVALGDYGWAAAVSEQGAALAREPGTSGSAALSLHTLGVVALDQGQYAQAAKLFEEAQVLYQADGEVAWRPVALSHLGLAMTELGDEPRAIALWEEVLADGNNRFAVAYALQHLGAVLGRRGEYRAAADRFQQSLAVWQELGDMWFLASCLGSVAAVAVACRQWEQGAILLGAAAVLRETSGGTIRPRERTLHEETLAAVRAGLDERDFATASADGRAMPLTDVIDGVGEIGRCDQPSATVVPVGSAGGTSLLHLSPLTE
jgi:predicted ATPase